ncbi:biotin--[acetyl-CoA-carboxylase] ligase [Prosthecobacter vanneervenii]|uniref:BirA family biotin operon repressor/biotin-[acetyl-CoA-carboxylase] ligase n=1 Tax=Prosthecobacter vanneervenii TaxID=48466 RepID=A0A7W8DKW6_9BACT|nr:biotin--[acetyl-CoA-carboxylase] ligase [Prosthecobacter vanneervenii]MBB5033276.1 BirA family biotin operon repressor/biotin-[acetyl-CoA-carboxylase] ligase [Prosthecobacter vanneervenii]
MIPLDASTLNASGLPWHVRVLDEVGSTSDWLKQNASELPTGTVVFTESQTAGRGRRENRWIAPRGKDLMFSLLLKPEAPLEKWPRITTLAALGICKAIEAELPLQPRIKWPNDIYLQDRKVSGLLAETVSTREGMRIVLGIGLNVNALDFPPELNATSLLRAVASPVLHEIDRNALGCRLLGALHAEFSRIDEDYTSAIAEVRERSWLIGRQIRCRVEGHPTHGRVLDLNEEGHLIIAMPDGTTATLTSAEEVRDASA